MKKFIVPLAMAFALAGFAPAFADTGTSGPPKATTPAPDDGTKSTTPKSDEKKKDEKGSTGTTTEPAPAPAPDAAK